MAAELFSATFEFLPAVGNCSHPSLNRDDIIRAVLTAVDEANQKLGTSYAVRRIRVPVNDTPPEAVYGALASAIIERAHANDADA